MPRIRINDVTKMKKSGLLDDPETLIKNAQFQKEPVSKTSKTFTPQIPTFDNLGELTEEVLIMRDAFNDLIDATNELTETPGARKSDNMISKLTKLSITVDQTFAKLGVDKTKALTVVAKNGSTHRGNRGILDKLTA